MDNRTKTTIVGFFGGTGYDFDSNAPGYVPQEILRPHKIKEAKRERNVDDSMAMLGRALDEKQERYGYDGCHRRGGGLFSYGIEEPADHLISELRKKLSPEENKKITLVLTAHSRGCLSALLAAKKLSEDPQLKKRVDVILDLRDPVPGNFQWSVIADSSSNVTDTRILYDLSACTNIKEARITVQEKGILNIAFNVLVPLFSPETDLEVEYLPGIHDIQENSRSQIAYNTEGDYFERHYAVFLLGICQSMKLYAKHNAIILADLFFDALIRYIDQVNVSYELPTCSERAKTLKEKIKILWEPSKEKPFEKDQLIAFLNHLEKLLYDNLLADLKLIHGHEGVRKRKTKPILSRALHFGGEYQQLTLLQEATHLNQQHALLAYERKPEAKLEFKPLLGFKGKRLDLSKTENASKAIIALRLACQNYLKKEEKQPTLPQSARGIVEALYKMVEQDPASPSFKAKKQMLCCFVAHYEKNKGFLKKNKKDDLTKKFCAVVGYILASLLTAGIYLGVRAYRSHKDRGSPKFWQTRKEIFTALVTDSIPKFVSQEAPTLG